MPQSYTSLHYHLIFSTKDRRPMIASTLRQRLYDYIGGIIRGDRGTLIAAGGTEDHVHLLATISKVMSVSDSLREIKANSSRWVHETFPQLSQFAWQAGYGAFSIGYSGLENVKGYIARQEEHHRTVTFKEEFPYPGVPTPGSRPTPCQGGNGAIRAGEGESQTSENGDVGRAAPMGRGEEALWQADEILQPVPCLRGRPQSWLRPAASGIRRP